MAWNCLAHAGASTLMKRLLDSIDYLSNICARVGGFLVLIMTLVVSYNVFMRYVFVQPTDWSFDVNYILGGSMMALGQAYTLMRGRHVRIDFLSTRFSIRQRLIVDILFTTVLFIPFWFLVAVSYWQSAETAVRMGQTLSQTTWYPPSWPFKAALAVGFTMFCLQGIAMLAKRVRQLVTGEGELS